MTRTLALLYGVVCYAIFLVTFLYAIWFVFTMDSLTPEPGSSWVRALVIDALVLSVFALQHSVMARQGFKRMWTRIIPRPIERSTFVLCSSLALWILFRAWQPLSGVIWEVTGAVPKAALQALSGVGWLIVLVATFMIDHFDLFGLKQVWMHFKGQNYQPPQFRSPGFYRMVRHPIYLGFIIAFWSTPVMTSHHLFFAVMTLGYILVAIQLEERDLLTFHGRAYEEYRGGVSMLMPWPSRRES